MLIIFSKFLYNCLVQTYFKKFCFLSNFRFTSCQSQIICMKNFRKFYLQGKKREQLQNCKFLISWKFLSRLRKTTHMSIRGGRLPSICSQFQTFLNLVRGGGSEFFNNFWNSKYSELSEGWGSSLIGNFSQIFPFFLVMAPLNE